MSEMRKAFQRFFRLGKMIKPHRKLLLGSLSCGVAGHLSSIGLLGFAALAAARLVSTGSFRGSGAAGATVAAAACALVRGALRYGEHYWGHDIAFRLLFDLRQKIFSALENLAPARILDRRSGDLSASVMGDVEAVETFFAHTLAPVMIGFLVPLTVLIVLASIHILLALTLLPFYLLMGLLIPLLSFANTLSLGQVYRKALGEMNSSMVENLQGLRELMLLGRDEEYLNRVLDDTLESGKTYRKIRANEGRLGAAVELILLLSAAAVSGMGVLLIQRGLLDVPLFVCALVVAMSSFGPLISLMFLSGNLVNTSAAAERIFALMDESPAVSDSAESVSPGTIQEVPEIRNLDFTYPGARQAVLENFSLKVGQGGITGLRAESGRGKSTILYMMMRFFDPQRGGVFLKNRPLPEFTLDKLRSGMTYFNQDTFLFNISVMENIRMARVEASDEEVIEAARQAGIHTLIESLPEGYATLAGERGSRFSSGEKQRIGLARIFLQNNEVILLDEPVSNLDHENEELVMENLVKGLKDRTVVLVSHRNTVMARAERIIDIQSK